MTIQDWGAIGEIVGGAGVIATLLYLATQIRQNTKHIASASLQAMSERIESKMMASATNSEFTGVLSRWMNGEELSEVELMQATAWFSSWMSDLQDGYRQMKLGVISEVVLRGRIYLLASMLESPHAKKQWEDTGHISDPAFKDWFEQQLGSHLT